MAKKKRVSRELMLKGARLSYPALWKKKAFEGDSDDGGGKAKYQSTFLISKKDKEQVKYINGVIDEIIEEMWGDRPKKLKDDRICFRDGDEDYPDTDGYENSMYVRASNDRRPKVVDNDKDKTPLAEDDGKPYAGCEVDAILNVWAQDHPKWGVRINASLEAVRFKRDGDPFGAPPVDVEKFEDDDDDDDKTARGRKKRSRNDDDDDDDKKSSKRRRSRDDDDEDEDDKTSRRSRRSRDDDDEDDDDSSSRRRRSRRDDD